MFWALASTVFIIYLYRKLNSGKTQPQNSEPEETVEAELTALTRQIAALERQLGPQTTENVKP